MCRGRRLSGRRDSMTTLSGMSCVVRSAYGAVVRAHVSKGMESQASRILLCGLIDDMEGRAVPCRTFSPCVVESGPAKTTSAKRKAALRTAVDRAWLAASWREVM